ncbi:MAG TPA: hypothetical protein VEV37_08650 [Bryobacteraceae bacterium]|nr:hypothetical protein [Bryobacteraceae bacterium]
MRTTVTLDPDVERLIRAAMRERGTSFKEALNQAVRDGFSNTRPRRRKFVQKTYDMGAPQLFRWDKALTVAEAMEDEELLRRMAQRK